jgi:hypothetical protein
MGCRGPDARVVRPTAAGEGGRQGEFLQGSANLCGAVVYEADLIRFALHIGSSVFLPFFFCPAGRVDHWSEPRDW